MKSKMESIDTKPSVVSRTVSLGPDSGDVKKLRNEFGSLEKRINEVQNHLQPILAEFRTGNLMSPAMAALHEQLIQVKVRARQWQHIKTVVVLGRRRKYPKGPGRHKEQIRSVTTRK